MESKKSVKVVSQVMAGAGMYGAGGDEAFAEKIEDLVNEGYDVKAAGCSGEGYGDSKGVHLCVAVMQKNLKNLEKLED